jgi:hypothetical protein
LYEDLDPMPPELIDIIVNYDSLEFQGKLHKSVDTKNKSQIPSKAILVGDHVLISSGCAFYYWNLCPVFRSIRGFTCAVDITATAYAPMNARLILGHVNNSNSFVADVNSIQNFQYDLPVPVKAMFEMKSSRQVFMFRANKTGGGAAVCLYDRLPDPGAQTHKGMRYLTPENQFLDDVCQLDDHRILCVFWKPNPATTSIFSIVNITDDNALVSTDSWSDNERFGAGMFMLDDDKVLAVSLRGLVTTFSVNRCQWIDKFSVFQDPDDRASCSCVCPERQLVIGTTNGGILIWDYFLRVPLIQWSSDCDRGPISSLVFHQPSNLLVSCSEKGYVCIWS